MAFYHFSRRKVTLILVALSSFIYTSVFIINFYQETEVEETNLNAGSQSAVPSRTHFSLQKLRDDVAKDLKKFGGKIMAADVNVNKFLDDVKKEHEQWKSPDLTDEEIEGI